MKSIRDSKRPVRKMVKPKKANRFGGFGVRKILKTWKTFTLKSGKTIPNMMISTYGPFENEKEYFFVVEFFDPTGTYHHYKPCQEDLPQKK